MSSVAQSRTWFDLLFVFEHVTQIKFVVRISIAFHKAALHGICLFIVSAVGGESCNNTRTAMRICITGEAEKL